MLYPIKIRMSNTEDMHQMSRCAEGSHKHQALHGHFLSPCRGGEGEYWKRHMR